MSQVLIVDDEESICWGLSRLLSQEGHSVSISSSAEDALEILAQQSTDLIVLDVRLPGMDGLSAMERFREVAGPVPILVITAFGSLTTAVAAMGNGAFDYLAKPFDLDQVSAAIHRALARGSRPKLTESSTDPLASTEELLGSSPSMQEVFKRIALVATTEAAVLIGGESGTGKELVARAIHHHSQRTNAPFVPVNLASLNPTLVESELFGHVRGAFTGAEDARQGLLELANGGTVLFDEAADIPLSVQVKLLRVLEQQELTPVGDSRARPAVFRVIAATNRDLREECAAGRFRQDLFFRLAVFEIHLPPLRERVEDIPILAERFLANLHVPNVAAPRLLADTLDELCRRPWPGNVRELRNAVEHGALMARGGAIAPEHLPPAIALSPRAATDPSSGLQAAVKQWAHHQLSTRSDARDLYRQFLMEAESPLIDAILSQTGQNRAAAAEMLGINRATLRKKLQ